MKSFNLDTLLENISILPTKDLLESKLTQYNIEGIMFDSVNFNVTLSEDTIKLDEFIQFAKKHNSNIYYKIIPFNKTDFMITTDTLDNWIIYEYISVLSNNNESGFSEKLSELLDNNELNKSDNELTVESFISSESYELDEDDIEDEYEDEPLNLKSIQILDEIKMFNDNIPDEINNYTEQLIVMCVVDNQKIGVTYKNEYCLDTEVCLAELLNSFELDYKESVKAYKEEQKRLAEEKLVIRQQAEEQLKIRLLSDKNFAICTNQALRQNFAENLYKNSEYEPIIHDLYGDNYLLPADTIRDQPERINYPYAKDLRNIIENIFRLNKDELKRLVKT